MKCSTEKNLERFFVAKFKIEFLLVFYQSLVLPREERGKVVTWEKGKVEVDLVRISYGFCGFDLASIMKKNCPCYCDICISHIRGVKA